MKFNPDKFKILLARKQLTYKGFSEQSGIPIVTISQALRGKRNPTLCTIGKLAHGLGVDVTELLNESEEARA